MISDSSKYFTFVIDVLYDMKDKIKSYMNYLGISAAQLADKIGVQRSSFSHILNGRNKPSADFITKLLEVYPDLNANWLLGKAENMLLSQRTKNKIPDLFSNSEFPLSIKEDISKSIEPEKFQSITQEMAEKRTSFINKERNIKKVIVFYDDFSFVEYKPQVDEKL